MEVDFRNLDMHRVCRSQCKKRKLLLDGADSSSLWLLCEVDFLPTLQSSDYYMKPCLSELAARELQDPGYCRRVPDFVVGRFGYGCVKFIGETDIRWLNLDQIVKFNRHEIVVYEDESTKPVVGQGLNKEAEVTLLLKTRSSAFYQKDCLGETVKKLKLCLEKQGAHFISFNSETVEWKFNVNHFSKFGLSLDDEEDIIMDDAPDSEVNDPTKVKNGEVSDVDDETSMVDSSPLSHSLPAHLRLDPVKMKEMRMILFPSEEGEAEDFDDLLLHKHFSSTKESKRSPLQHSPLRAAHKSTPPVTRKMPLALLDYNPGNFGSSSPGSILVAQQNKALALKIAKVEGFKLDLNHETPVTGSHSRNLVDAALFMGRSFRAGWGPNGILVHTGATVGSNNSERMLFSTIKMEKIAIDNLVRDENNKVREELIDFCFESLLSLHKDITHQTKDFKVGSFGLKLQKLVCDRIMLADICRSYIQVIERQLEVSSLSSSTISLLMHQVLVWELIKVLFSSRKMNGQSQSFNAEDEEDMMHDRKEMPPEVDPEALPLIRRAEFSYWLQESVWHRVQDGVASFSESNDLQHILLLLTGRQLDAAVELAASRGDVRLACLLSQAGGSTVNRSEISEQLDLWRINGMDFNFIEKDRVRLLELLAGNIHDALCGMRIDWKRFLGLLMWYQLPPDTSLPVIFHTYKQLVNGGNAPYPVPVYIDEGLVEDTNWKGMEHFDLAYYLMLLHASEERDFGVLKAMFCAFASTHDAFDHHMIWHYRVVLEAVGIFSSNDLHILDMGLVSQLLCLGKCHWAIYVVLHMPHREDYPYLHATVIREILLQYCETWSADEMQRQFIEDLGIPLAWMNEALVS